MGSQRPRCGEVRSHTRGSRGPLCMGLWLVHQKWLRSVASFWARARRIGLASPSRTRSRSRSEGHPGQTQESRAPKRRRRVGALSRRVHTHTHVRTVTATVLVLDPQSACPSSAIPPMISSQRVQSVRRTHSRARCHGHRARRHSGQNLGACSNLSRDMCSGCMALMPMARSGPSSWGVWRARVRTA